MPIKIVIADDHPMVLSGLRNILLSFPELKVIGSYENGFSLMEALKEGQPDVLLLDLQFPDTTGDKLVRLLKPLYPDMKILVVTSVDDPYEVQEMMKIGCSGYVHKTIAPNTLFKAIETVYYGETFLEPYLKESLLKAMLRPGKKNLQKIVLSSREQEVLELLSQGLTNMDIGQKLFLSHRTIENHRAALYEKFDVTNTASLVKVAVQAKFIQ